MLNGTYLSNESLWDNSSRAMRYQSYAQRSWWINEINLWFQVVMIPVGIVGNSLCLLVMNQKQNRSISCSVYMSALAVTDSLVLTANALNLFLVHGVLGSVLERGRALCRAMDYLFHTSAHTGVMIILALMLERVIVVIRPMKAVMLLSPKRALIVICVMIIPTASYNIPTIFFTSARVNPQGIKCGEFAGRSDAHAPYIMANFIIPGLLPLAAMLIMNILIIVAFKSARYQKYLRDDSSISESTSSVTTDASATSVTTRSNKQEDRKKRRERQLTMMAVVMTSAFILCTLPSYIHDLVFTNAHPSRSRLPLQIQQAYPWSEMITQNLMALNSAINFFVYAISGSKFRKDLVNLCKRKSG